MNKNIYISAEDLAEDARLNYELDKWFWMPYRKGFALRGMTEEKERREDDVPASKRCFEMFLLKARDDNSFLSTGTMHSNAFKVQFSQRRTFRGT